MRKLIRWIGIILGGLLGLLVLAAVVFYFIGGAKFSKKYDVPVETVSIPTDANAVARGSHLATILLCTRCHSDDLSGQVYFDVPGLLSIPTPTSRLGLAALAVFTRIKTGCVPSDMAWAMTVEHCLSCRQSPTIISVIRMSRR